MPCGDKLLRLRGRTFFVSRTMKNSPPEKVGSAQSARPAKTLTRLAPRLLSDRLAVTGLRLQSPAWRIAEALDSMLGVFASALRAARATSVKGGC